MKFLGKIGKVLGLVDLLLNEDDGEYSTVENLTSAAPKH